MPSTAKTGSWPSRAAPRGGGGGASDGLVSVCARGNAQAGSHRRPGCAQHLLKRRHRLAVRFRRQQVTPLRHRLHRALLPQHLHTPGRVTANSGKLLPAGGETRCLGCCCPLRKVAAKGVPARIPRRAPPWRLLSVSRRARSRLRSPCSAAAAPAAPSSCFAAAVTLGHQRRSRVESAVRLFSVCRPSLVTPSQRQRLGQRGEAVQCLQALARHAGAAEEVEVCGASGCSAPALPCPSRHNTRG
jgi:hypothetical protein